MGGELNGFYQLSSTFINFQKLSPTVSKGEHVLIEAEGRAHFCGIFYHIDKGDCLGLRPRHLLMRSIIIKIKIFGSVTRSLKF